MIDAREFAEWLAYWRIEPVGEGDDVRAARICAVVANAHRRTRRAYSSRDFMPQRAGSKRWRERQSPKKMRAALAPLFAIAGVPLPG